MGTQHRARGLQAFAKGVGLHGEEGMMRAIRPRGSIAVFVILLLRTATPVQPDAIVAGLGLPRAVEALRFLFAAEMMVSLIVEEIMLGLLELEYARTI